MVLRSLEPADLGGLVDLQREGAVAALGHIFPQASHPFPTATIRQRWVAELADPATDCFAVVDDGRLSGFAATRAGEFLHFGTAVRTWGTGLAGRAHDEVLDHLRSRGHRDAWLWVFEENVRAVRFYRRRGWRATGEAKPTDFPPYPTLRRFELRL